VLLPLSWILPTKYFNEINVLYSICMHPVHGEDHQARLESFYASQASNYDAFRRKLLKGREQLIEELRKQRLGGVWVDMGGGTGANLEMAGSEMIGKFSKVYIVDLSTSLLAVARQRAEKNGWKNVECVEGDATTWVPPEGKHSVSVVSFSYSLTMIPDWFKAVDHARDVLLNPRHGICGVVDFYVARKYPSSGMASHSWFQRNFWPMWFANDNVNLNPNHLPYLKYKFTERTRNEKSASVPYIGLFLPNVPIYIFVGDRKM